MKLLCVSTVGLTLIFVVCCCVFSQAQEVDDDVQIQEDTVEYFSETCEDCDQADQAEQNINEYSQEETRNNDDDMERSSENQEDEEVTSDENSCETSKTIIHGKYTKLCVGDLIFEDEFNENVINTDKWRPEVCFAEGPDYPFVVYMDNHRTLYFSNGDLCLKPDLLETMYGSDFISYGNLDLSTLCTGDLRTSECNYTAFGANILPPVMSSKITTKHSFNFMYGKIEFIAKLPRGDWMFPEIQLEPLSYVYGQDNYASGLMRIAYAKGNLDQSKLLQGGLIMSDREPFRSYGLRSILGRYAWHDDYFTYTLLWTPDGIKLHWDGEVYGEVTPPEDGFSELVGEQQPASVFWQRSTELAPFDQMFHLSIGVGVGGINDFPEAPGKPWTNKQRKAMYNFWESKHTWYPTWTGQDSVLRIKSVKIYAV